MVNINFRAILRNFNRILMQVFDHDCTTNVLSHPAPQCLALCGKFHQYCDGRSFTSTTRDNVAPVLRGTTLHQYCEGQSCTSTARVEVAPVLRGSKLHQYCEGQSCTSSARVEGGQPSPQCVDYILLVTIIISNTNINVSSFCKLFFLLLSTN